MSALPDGYQTRFAPSPSPGQAGLPDKAAESRIVEPKSRPDGPPDNTRTTTVDPPPMAFETDILDLFAADLRLAGVAGEQRFAKLTYLCLTSRLLDWGKPTSRPVSLIGKGTSSTGKSHTQRTVLRFFPQSAFFDLGSMSRRYLLYSEETLSYRFLVIPEWAVIAQDEEIVAALRTLLSEGRLIHGTVSTDGKPKAHRIEKEGPTGLLMTTTAAAVDSELETRCLADFTDDTPEQTRRVYEVLAGLEHEDVDPVDWPRWHALQEWLAAHGERRVAIPYIQAIAELFPVSATRLRRDFVSTLCLIRAHAILHQASRERDAVGRILATVDDYEQVRKLVGALIAEGADAGVSPAMRATVEAVRLLLELRGRDFLSMKAIADGLSVGRSAAYDRVSRALFKGYLVNVAGKEDRARKIALGSALPGEELFLPSRDALVRVSSGTATGQVSGSTTRDSEELSGSPGRPAGGADGSFPLLGDEGLPEALLAAVDAGHITSDEAAERYELHKLICEARAA